MILIWQESWWLEYFGSKSAPNKSLGKDKKWYVELKWIELS